MNEHSIPAPQMNDLTGNESSVAGVGDWAGTTVELLVFMRAESSQALQAHCPHADQIRFSKRRDYSRHNRQGSRAGFSCRTPRRIAPIRTTPKPLKGLALTAGRTASDGCPHNFGKLLRSGCHLWVYPAMMSLACRQERSIRKCRGRNPILNQILCCVSSFGLPLYLHPAFDLLRLQNTSQRPYPFGRVVTPAAVQNLGQGLHGRKIIKVYLHPRNTKVRSVPTGCSIRDRLSRSWGVVVALRKL